jgi:hypothetical protein
MGNGTNDGKDKCQKPHNHILQRAKQDDFDIAKQTRHRCREPVDNQLAFAYEIYDGFHCIYKYFERLYNWVK